MERLLNKHPMDVYFQLKSESRLDQLDKLVRDGIITPHHYDVVKNIRRALDDTNYKPFKGVSKQVYN